MRFIRSLERLFQVVLFTGIGILGIGSVVFAFQNISTTGGGAATLGSIGTLQQVTRVGNTTTLPVYLSGVYASSSAGSLLPVLSVSGTARFDSATNFGSTVTVGNTLSVVNSPSNELQFTGSDNTNIGSQGGIYLSSSAANPFIYLGVTTDGTQFSLGAGGVTTTLPFSDTSVNTSTFAGPVSSTIFIAGAGSVGSPSFTFSPDLTTGLYDSGSLLAVAQGGTTQATFGGSAVRTLFLYPLSDITYDAGDATLRWRNVYGQTINSSNVSSTGARIGYNGGNSVLGSLGVGAATSSNYTMVIQSPSSGTGALQILSGTGYEIVSSGSFDVQANGAASIGAAGVNNLSIYGSGQEANPQIRIWGTNGDLHLRPGTTGVVTAAFAPTSTTFSTQLNASTTAANANQTILSASGTVDIAVPSNTIGLQMRDSNGANAKLQINEDTASWAITTVNNGNLTLGANNTSQLRVTAAGTVDCFTSGSVCLFGSTAVPWKAIYASSTAAQTAPPLSVSGTSLFASGIVSSAEDVITVKSFGISSGEQAGYLIQNSNTTALSRWVSNPSTGNSYITSFANINFVPGNASVAGTTALSIQSAVISSVLPITASATGAIAPILSTTGTIFHAGIGAPGVTEDIVCYRTADANFSHQAANCTVSSAYFKDHIKSLSDADLLDEVRKLRAVSYVMKATGKDEEGFIAEEVARIDPALVIWTDGTELDSKEFANRIAFEEKNYPDVIRHKDGKTLIPQTVDYARVSVVLAGAMQAEDQRITNLEKKVGIIERVINSLKSLFKK